MLRSQPRPAAAHSLPLAPRQEVHRPALLAQVLCQRVLLHRERVVVGQLKLPGLRLQQRGLAVCRYWVMVFSHLLFH